MERVESNEEHASEEVLTRGVKIIIIVMVYQVNVQEVIAVKKEHGVSIHDRCLIFLQ